MHKLNAQQTKAVTQAGAALVIIAGPGTGKTKTLVARILHLLNAGVPAQNILALTFTKKAATEMRERLGQNSVWVGTFHALCHQILGGDLQFITEPQRLSIVKGLHKPAVLKHLSTRELGLAISRAKNMQDNSLADVLTAYNQALAAKGLIDLDDLLVKTKQVLLADPAKQKELQAQFTHILVDEFQDTNQLQYDILKLLYAPRTSMFVIGDPKQTIYGFRGAVGDIFAQFAADFAPVTTIRLTVNYRSAAPIVQFSNTIFGDSLTAHSQQAGQVAAVQVLNEYSEANWILQHIQQAIGGSDLQRAVSNDDSTKNGSLRDFAVLYRSRAAARTVQQVLTNSGLPVQVVGEGSPYEDPKVQEVIALLGACSGQDVPALALCNKTQTQVLLEKINKNEPPFELAEKILLTFGYKPTAAMQQLLVNLARFKNLPSALAYFKTLADQQFYDPAAEAITLLTIHAAKGLEFAQVFLIAVQEGMLPHEKADKAEEKRLFYVAATRAKSRFFALHTLVRGGKKAVPSQFILAMPQICDPQLSGDIRRTQKRQAKRAQTTLF